MVPDVGQVKTVKDVLPGLTSSASGSTHSGPGKKVEKFKSSIREVSSPLSKLKSPNKFKPSISSRDMLSPHTFKLYTGKLFKLYTDNLYRNSITNKLPVIHDHSKICLGG